MCQRRPQLRQQLLLRRKRQRHRSAAQGAFVEGEEDIHLGERGRQVVRVRPGVVGEPGARGVGEGGLAEKILLSLGFFLLATLPALRAGIGNARQRKS
jgi:hypothetical protein